MKIRLLNDGGYAFLKYINLPVEVEAQYVMSGACEVHADELVRVGCKRTDVNVDKDDPWWPFNNFDGKSFEEVL